jgi:hypothetical protein
LLCAWLPVEFDDTFFKTQAPTFTHTITTNEIHTRFLLIFTLKFGRAMNIGCEHVKLNIRMVGASTIFG